MKVIDLLNKIANGEKTPDRFIYDGMLFERYLDNYYRYYDRKNTMSNIIQFSEEICSDYSNLNDEIEIIEDTPEENNKIEKLDLDELNNLLRADLSYDNLFYRTHKMLVETKSKINEIIDKINGE